MQGFLEHVGGRILGERERWGGAVHRVSKLEVVGGVNFGGLQRARRGPGPRDAAHVECAADNVPLHIEHLGWAEFTAEKIVCGGLRRLAGRNAYRYPRQGQRDNSHSSQQQVFLSPHDS